jgi:hypothetical protein
MPGGAALEFHLFVWTGEGIVGYHYDPLLLRRLPAHVVVVDEDDAQPTSNDSTARQDAAPPPVLDPTASSSTDGIGKTRPRKRLRALETHPAGPEIVDDSSGAVPGGIAPDADLEHWQEELRKRYTPARIDSGTCLARVFGGGKGGQCANKPKLGRTCGRCGAEPKHGFVTGQIPREKWNAFGITDELVRQLGGGAPSEKPGIGDGRSAHLGNEPSRKRQASVPIVAPVSSSALTPQPVMLLKRRRGDGLGRRVDPSEPEVGETAGNASAESRGRGRVTASDFE